MKFQDPPNAKKGFRSSNYAAEATALRERPGEWALFQEGVSNAVSTNIKQGRMADFRPAGHFEATSRLRPDRKFDIYVRYVGGVA